MKTPSCFASLSELATRDFKNKAVKETWGGLL